MDITNAFFLGLTIGTFFGGFVIFIALKRKVDQIVRKAEEVDQMVQRLLTGEKEKG